MTGPDWYRSYIVQALDAINRLSGPDANKEAAQQLLSMVLADWVRTKADNISAVALSANTIRLTCRSASTHERLEIDMDRTDADAVGATLRAIAKELREAQPHAA